MLLERFFLLVSDALSLTLSLYLFLDLRDMAALAGTPPVLAYWMQEDTGSHFIAFLSSAVLVLYWFWSGGHYSRRMPFWDEFGQLVRILVTGFFTEIGLILLLSPAGVDWHPVIFSWISALLLVSIGRFLTKHLMLCIGLWRRDAVIIGMGENGQAAYAALGSELLMGYRVTCFAKGPGEGNVGDGAEFYIEGRQFPIVDIVTDPVDTLLKLGKPQLIVALDRVTGNEEFVNRLGSISTNVLVFPSIRGLPLQGVEASHFFGRELLMLRIQNNLLRRSPRIAKRIFDVMVAAALLILLSPVLMLISFLIRRDGAHALYGHVRIGSSGREFRCLKFRSMVANADEVLEELLSTDTEARVDWERDFKLKNDPRVTRLGAFLRKSSLDELPQLINVLRGEMSLVGPRPVVQAELDRYADKVAYYFQVRPGITGLWQVSGRNDVDYATRVGLDVWYVKNWSLWTDIVILLKTVRVVAFRIGAY